MSKINDKDHAAETSRKREETTTAKRKQRRAKKYYEVQRIVDVAVLPDGTRKFLVHWKGWSSRFDTWVPQEHLKCDKLIKAFDAEALKRKRLKPLQIAVKWFFHPKRRTKEDEIVESEI